jgi:HK97 family phage prohead protease
MAEEGQQTKVVGYAAKFNQWSSDLGGFIERIAPTAFDKADMSDVRGLIDHDPSRILGRTTSGTLKVSVDEIGLRYEIDMPDTSYARDLIESMKRGDINQSSFAFRVNYENPEAEEWRFNDQTGVYERTINEFSGIFDVSPVTYPAYPSTESVVSHRNLDKLKQNELEKEVQKRRILLELDLMLLQVDEDDEEEESQQPDNSM